MSATVGGCTCRQVQSVFENLDLEYCDNTEPGLGLPEPEFPIWQNDLGQVLVKQSGNACHVQHSSNVCTELKRLVHTL